MDSEAIRLGLLQILLDWEHSGDSRMIEARDMAAKLDVKLEEVIDQLDILETRGAVKLYKALGNGEGNTATITGIGKDMVELSQQSPRAETVAIENSKSTAVQLLEQVAVELCSSYDILACFRKSLLAIRLLGWDDSWVSNELNGYSRETVPEWRIILSPQNWVGPGLRENIEMKSAATVHPYPEIHGSSALVGLWHPLVELYEAS